MKKRDVHIVLETGSLSGGVRVVGEVANHLHRRGHKVTIWSLNPKESLTGWFKLDGGIDFISFFKTGTIQDYGDLTYLLSKQSGIKIATYWRTAFSVSQASKDGEGFYLVQDIETSYTSIPSVSKVIMDTYELGLHHFTTSRWVEKQINTDYMGIGIDTSFYKNMNYKRDRLMVLGIVRQQSLKGWDVLCEATRHLSVRGISVTMFGLPPTLRVFVAPMDYISQPDDDAVLDLYNTASCFMSTSRHEGFNLTALEAMSCGCPVVKTLDDGSDEYIDDGGNCLIGRDANELANMVTELLGNRTKSDMLARNAIVTASQYKWSTAIDRLETILAT